MTAEVPRRLLKAKEVANLFRETVNSFYRKRDERRSLGFPEPVPGTRLWDPAAVAAWQNRQAGLAGAEARAAQDAAAERSNRLAAKARRIAGDIAVAGAP